MSKGVVGLLTTVAAIAVVAFAPEILPAALAAGTLAGSAVIAGAEIGIALLGHILTAGKPKSQTLATNLSRLSVTMDTTAPRKAVFGITAGAADLRYQVYTGSNQDTYWQVICIASHQVNAITELWIDNEQAWTSGGGVLGRYSGFLTVQTVLAGTSANGIAIDGTWTSHCTLTGCAYVVVSYKLSDASSSSKSPFASGVSQRVTIRCQGALVYDPRLDSTVTGGSGSQRAGTQSTWAWDANASCNPAIQLLWYLLGWQINGKLALGMGIPASRINLASFITAANHCDEAVSLSGGGTEPRYRTYGVISEADDRQAVIETLCSCMGGAMLTDSAGTLTLTVLTGTDLSSPVASFTEADILGTEQWDETPDLHSMFNIVRGRRTDPSNTSLYQPVDYPEQSVTSLDGIDRIDTTDYLMVESNATAQRLAQLRLNKQQYPGVYSFDGGERYWQVNIGDIIQQSHAGLNWTNRIFRVIGQAISRTGQTKMILREENSSAYTWSASESAAITPGSPTVFNPTNAPLNRAINSITVQNGGTSSGLDNISDGSTYFRMPGANMDSNRRGLIDFTQAGHISKNLDNIGDGSTYGRTVNTYLNSNRPVVNFADAFHSNKNLDNIADGGTYGRPILTRLSGGKPLIDFSEGIHLNKNVDNLADGTTYGRPLLTRLNGGNPLIDFSAAYHLNKNLDNIADGSSYARIASANVSGGAHVWGTIVSRPANVAALSGSENLFNSGQPNLIFNGGLRVVNSSNWPLGWTQGTNWHWTGGGPEGPYAYIQSGGTVECDGDLFPAYVNYPYVLQAEIFCQGTAGDCACDVEFFDSNGTHIAYSNRCQLNAGNIWTSLWTAFTSPANTASARVRFFIENWTPNGGTAAIRRLKLSGGSTKTMFSDEGTNSHTAVTRSGTGMSVGAIYLSGTALYGFGTGNGSNVANSGISIGSNGALSGGGGGQVTIGGITPNGLDNLADGTTYFRMPAANMDTNRRALVDFSQSGHLNKTFANIGGTATAAQVPTAGAITGQGALATKSSVDPSTSDVLATGSVPPSVPSSSFSYSSTTTSITLSWNAMTIYRADGTTISVSSGSQSVTGLSSGLTYKVYPYVADNGGPSGTVAWVATGSPAGSGSPTICFNQLGNALAAANMVARGNIPLNSFSVSTPSSGTGSGGGGGFSCLHPHMRVGDAMAESLEAGDLIPTPEGTAPIQWLQRREHSEWLIVYSGEVEVARVTPEHRFYRANGEEVRARELHLGDLLKSRGDHVEVTGLMLDEKPATLVSIELEEPHLYYAGPLDLLCHNVKQ